MCGSLMCKFGKWGTLLWDGFQLGAGQAWINHNLWVDCRCACNEFGSLEHCCLRVVWNSCSENCLVEKLAHLKAVPFCCVLRDWKILWISQNGSCFWYLMMLMKARSLLLLLILKTEEEGDIDTHICLNYWCLQP